MLPLLACADTGFTVEHERFDVGDRVAYVALPDAEPPFPVALAFQGSLAPAELFFDGNPDLPLGGYHQAEVVRALVQEGYAVVAPEAAVGGLTWWNTNVPGYEDDWEQAPDHAFMLEVFAAVDGGDFGPLDGERIVALGISSGGYMTSRMAVSYPGRVSALVIVAASYATCSGAACDVPELPEDHPPTLFLHGEQDPVVPVSTMWDYADRLDGAEVLVDPERGHEWSPDAPATILDFL